MARGEISRARISLSPAASATTVLMFLIIFATAQVGYFEYAVGPDALNSGTANLPILTRLGTLSTLCCALTCVYGVYRKIQPSLAVLVLLLVHIVLAISCLWSRAPLTSLEVILKSAIYIYAVVTLSALARPSHIAQALTVSILAICTASAFLILTNSQFAVTGDVAGWRGAFAHKNGLSAFCAFGVFALVWSWATSTARVLTIGTILACLALLAGSLGKTGTLITFAFFGVIIFAGLAERTKMGRLFASSAVYIAVSAALLFLASNGTLSEDALTGRGRLWREFMPLVLEHPFFGMGGVATVDPELRAMMWRAVGQAQPHNSYIALTLSIGLPAILLFGLFYLAALSEQAANPQRSEARAATAIILAYTVFGVVESTYALMASFPLLVLVLASMRQKLRPSSQRAQRSNPMGEPKHAAKARVGLAACNPPPQSPGHPSPRRV